MPFDLPFREFKPRNRRSNLVVNFTIASTLKNKHAHTCRHHESSSCIGRSASTLTRLTNIQNNNDNVCIPDTFKITLSSLLFAMICFLLLVVEDGINWVNSTNWCSAQVVTFASWSDTSSIWFASTGGSLSPGVAWTPFTQHFPCSRKHTWLWFWSNGLSDSEHQLKITDTGI